jgi:hypothetical protein
MLVLLIGGIYDYVIEIAAGSIIYITKFHDDRFKHSSNIKVITEII